MMANSISITRLYELVDVDLLRGLVFSRRRRNMRPMGSLQTDGYRQISLDGRLTLASHIVWAFANGAWPPEDKVVDHINGDRDDNRISNLRLASHAQNSANVSKALPSSRTRVRGVSFRRDGFYHAQIRVFGRPVHLGRFPSLAQARLAYEVARLQMFPEHAPSKDRKH